MTDTARISQAFNFAAEAHASIGQVRKYSSQPYIEHPVRVVDILRFHKVDDVETLQVAYLHDVLEDVAPKNPIFSDAAIHKLFGERVLGLVLDLTDVYTHENFPNMNRAARKQAEAERISRIADASLKVKLADLIDNTSDISKQDPGFYRVYLTEKLRILNLINDRVVASSDSQLYSLYFAARSQIHSINYEHQIES